jgi:DNA-binding MarR family transcriptional regulator
MAKRTGALLIPEPHLEKHVRHFAGAFEPLNAQVLFALRALAQRVNDHATEVLSPLGLTARQYNYLAVIYVEERVTPNEISKLIHTANASVTSMLNSLERDGLITRTEHPDDKRSFVVELTPAGKELYDRAFKVNHAHTGRMMERLSVTERKALIELLVKLGDAVRDESRERRTGAKTR